MITRNRIIFFVMALSLWYGSLVLAGAPSFQGLGRVDSLEPLRGAIYEAAAVSADGTTVVGRVLEGLISDERSHAFMWTEDNGIRALGDFPDGRSWSYAMGVSADGAVVVGIGTSIEPAYVWRPYEYVLKDTSVGKAFKWTESQGMVELYDGNEPGYVPHFPDPFVYFGPFIKSAARSVSADGSVIVGSTNNNAVRWTIDGEMEELMGQEANPSMTFTGQAQAVSPDGEYIVGQLSRVSAWWHDDFEDHQAVTWQRRGEEYVLWDGLGHLLDVPGRPYGIATAVSSGPKAPYAVGYETYSFQYEQHTRAFRTAQRGYLQDLGSLDGGSSEAYGISDDGSVVVGQSDGVAFIWDEVNGMRDLKQVLETEFGLDLFAWDLRSATSISPDGRTIVGNGIRLSIGWPTDPDVPPEPVALEPGYTEAWIVRLP